MVFLSAGCVAAIEEAKDALREDLVFEHLGDPDEVVWQFAGHALVEAEGDRVDAFVSEHARIASWRTCFVGVEYLDVQSEISVLGLQLIPLDDPRVPSLLNLPALKPTAGCVAAVEVQGTHLGVMGQRAKTHARAVLRRLRFALRSHRSIHDRQLRFRVAEAYAYDERLHGWQTPADAAWGLTLGPELSGFAGEATPAVLAGGLQTKLQRHLDLALRWLERAAMTDDPITALLYGFFALEALLGDKTAGLKAQDLAFRQTMLSHEVEGHFPHPERTMRLYDEVRSAAVHGEAIPDIGERELQSFLGSVRTALRQVCRLAEEESLVSRSRLRAYLDAHPDRPEVEDWLRGAFGDSWGH